MHALNLRTPEAEAAEFKNSLVYKVNSRAASQDYRTNVFKRKRRKRRKRGEEKKEKEEEVVKEKEMEEEVGGRGGREGGEASEKVEQCIQYQTQN